MPGQNVVKFLKLLAGFANRFYNFSPGHVHNQRVGVKLRVVLGLILNSIKCVFRLTQGSKYYILLCGMNLQLNIRNKPSRIAIYLSFLMLFASISASFGNAMANTCQRGADCLVCNERPHGHVPGVRADMQNPGCPPDGQNGTCGFEGDQSPDKFYGILASVRSYSPVNTGIFTAAPNGFDACLLSGEFISKSLLSDSDGAVPIYLQNQSLLR
jgi:hypothetical protein